jgi:hypothetical protein
MRHVSSDHLPRPVRGVILAIMLTAAISGCARATAPPQEGSPTGGASPTAVGGGVDDRLAIYATMIRELAGAEGPSWDRIFVVTDICANAADAAEPARCADVLSSTDQQALTEALPRLSDRLRFIDDPTPLYSDAWFEGTGPSTVVIRVGPVVRTPAGAEVGASYGCGGLCGSGTTYQLRSSSDGWTVTGSAGGTWIA